MHCIKQKLTVREHSSQRMASFWVSFCLSFRAAELNSQLVPFLSDLINYHVNITTVLLLIVSL
jgi:hypothetical protein